MRKNTVTNAITERIPLWNVLSVSAKSRRLSPTLTSVVRVQVLHVRAWQTASWTDWQRLPGVGGALISSDTELLPVAPAKPDASLSAAVTRTAQKTPPSTSGASAGPASAAGSQRS